MLRGTVIAVLVGAVLAGGSATAATTQSFDGTPGTAYAHPAAGEYGTCPVETATIGTDPLVGSFLRLVDADGVGCNSVTFERTDPGGVAALTATFQFRITPTTTPGLPSADGLGFALVDDSRYPPWGRLLGLFEEPSFDGSIGVGFDVYQNAGEDDGNHVSVHFGAWSQSFAVDEAALDLDGDGWISARVDVDFIAGGVSVTLTRVSDGAVVVAVPPTVVPGLEPYEGRVHFGARSGGGAADHDLADVLVTYQADEWRFGRWDPVADWPADDDPSDGETRGLVAIHAHLLPNGKVLMWDRHDLGHRRLRTWDPATGEWGDLGDLMDRVGYDPFCAGHSYLGDGRLMVSGGHIEDLVGEAAASTYDAFTDEWTRLPDMNAGRWYPTSTTLSDGSVLVTSGHIDLFEGRNTLPQVWEPGLGAWRNLDGAVRELGFYPFMFLIDEGLVFHAGPERSTGFLTIDGQGEWSPYGDPVDPDTGQPVLARHGYRDYGSAVRYRHHGILLVGGANYAQPVPTTRTTESIVMDGSVEPVWTPRAPMMFRRKYVNATLLPDGSVLATGGTSSAVNDARERVLAAEVWSPSTDEWTLLAGMQTAGLYHSSALLLPDGRVLATGGGHPAATFPGAGETGDYAAGEVYSPPYLFKGPRPEVGPIEAPPGELPRINYGDDVMVPTEDGDRIASAVWMRLSSVTHSFNQDQRRVDAWFQVVPGGVKVRLANDRGSMPPGPYMLFLIDVDGVPSVGQIVRTNQWPRAIFDTVVVDEDEPLPDLRELVLANDYDPDGDAIDFVNPPMFDRPPDWNGEMTTAYAISDGQATSAAELRITVREVNDAPVAMDDVLRVQPGERVLVNLLSNDRDVDGAFELVRCTPPPFGTAECAADGELTYVAGDLDELFEYTVRDEHGAEATASVSVLVFNDTCAGYCCCEVSGPEPTGTGGGILVGIVMIVLGAVRYRRTGGTSRSRTVLRPSAAAERTARSQTART